MGYIREAQVQVGASATAANNLTLDTSANNGTGTIYFGNAGTSVQNVMSFSGGKAALSQPYIAPGNTSMVWVQLANPMGTTNTTVARFQTVVTNQGTDITYTDSATLGATFTINTSGTYGMSFTFIIAGGGQIGIYAGSQILTARGYTTAGTALHCNTTQYLTAGTVVTAQSGVSPGTPTGYHQFNIARIS